MQQTVYFNHYQLTYVLTQMFHLGGLLQINASQIAYLYFSPSLFEANSGVSFLEQSEAVDRRCSVIKAFLKISHYSQENTFLESLFNKVAGVQTCNFIKKRIQRRCEYCEIFRNFYSEGHLQTAVMFCSQNVQIFVFLVLSFSFDKFF